MKRKSREGVSEKKFIEKMRRDNAKLFTEVQGIMNLAAECGVTGYQFNASEDAPIINNYKIF
jgi:hypothetical protein